MSTHSGTGLAARLSLATAIVAGIASVAIAAVPVVAAGDDGAAGSWQLTIDNGSGQPQLSLVTLDTDGTVVAADAPVATFGEGGSVVFASGGHGAWQANGTDGFALTFVETYVDGKGTLVYVVTIVAQGTVDGDTVSGTSGVTIAGPDGTVLGSFPAGTFAGTRITVQPMPSFGPAPSAGASMMPAASPAA